MRIGLLSDTHQQTQLHREAISNLIANGAEYILHSGDIGSQNHLDILRDAQLPFVVVFGNNDHHLTSLSSTYPIYKEPYYFKIKDIKIKMMHIPIYMSADSDIIISGHTHIFDTRSINGKLFINSGEVCAREKRLSQHVIIEVSDSEWIVEYYHKHPNHKKWNKRIFRSDRF